MLAHLESAAVWGVDAYPIQIEVNVCEGEWTVVHVGLPDTAVRESRDRVKSAIENSGYRYEYQRITVNLAPADLKKEGPSFDLPIAIGLLAATGQIPKEELDSSWMIGELALNGMVRPVKGMIAIAHTAKKRGVRRIFVPESNLGEAAVVEGITVYSIHHLRQIVDFLAGKIHLEPVHHQIFEADHSQHHVDFSDVKGQENAKRAIEVCVSGGHHLLMLGPPGSGKSMLAKRIPTIFPSMSLEESMEVSRIHSVAGLLESGASLLRERSFRSPHHTISDIGLIGGSKVPSPGEVSLAHEGVLFLDEFPEFRRSTLEVLRQPLEDGKVTITRATGTLTFPARFMLVAAMNPSPTSRQGEGGNSPGVLSQKYRDRISGPLLDRIDVQIEVPALKKEDFFDRPLGESSGSIRDRVSACRERQSKRFKETPAIRCNSQMGATEIRKYCALGEMTQKMMEQSLESLRLSARGFDRVLKVARTIADLADRPTLIEEDLFEAIQFRSLERNYWR